MGSEVPSTVLFSEGRPQKIVQWKEPKAHRFNWCLEKRNGIFVDIPHQNIMIFFSSPFQVYHFIFYFAATCTITSKEPVTNICSIDQNTGFTGIGICSGYYQQNSIESREKASKLSFWWSDDKIWKNNYALRLCVYSDICHISIVCFTKLLSTLLSVLVLFDGFCN